MIFWDFLKDPKRVSGFPIGSQIGLEQITHPQSIMDGVNAGLGCCEVGHATKPAKEYI